MKKVTLIFLFWAIVFMMTIAQSDSSLIETSNVAINPPANKSPSTIPHQYSFRTEPELWLSLMVLVFSILVILLETYLIKIKAFEGSQAIKFIVVTLIITASLFLITAGFSSEQITPIIGLLGTIVGYLLGSNAYKSTVTKK